MSVTIYHCGCWTSTAHSSDRCVGCKGPTCKCCLGVGTHTDASTLRNARKVVNSAFVEAK